MTLRDVNLDQPLLKVTEHSERCVHPADTYRAALHGLSRKRIIPDFHVRDIGNVFWVADFDPGFRRYFPEFDHELRMSGKGPSRDQCMASAVMEFVERLSFHAANLFGKKEYECIDLRDGRLLTLGPILELRNTKCVASGNTYEEAILHCLHELLETRIPHSILWKPFKVVPVDLLFPDVPEWVGRSIMLVLSPAELEGFCHFTALLYPHDDAFEEPSGYKLVREGTRLTFVPFPAKLPKHHSPNSGGAAGLNPRKTAFRAMNEIFQFQKCKDWVPDGTRRPLPVTVPVALLSEMPNHESPSITADIRFILDMLGDDVFVGVIDFTDPEIGLPVVKLISDYAPGQSLASRETLAQFFRF